MNREEIIELVRQAGFDVDKDGKLFLYGGSDCLLKANYCGTIIDGIKSVIELAREYERKKISSLIAKMPGDTAASIAIWVREQ